MSGSAALWRHGATFFPAVLLQSLKLSWQGGVLIRVYFFSRYQHALEYYVLGRDNKLQLINGKDGVK